MPKRLMMTLRLPKKPGLVSLSYRTVIKITLSAWEMFIDESLRHCETVYEALDVTLTRNDLDAESRYNNDLSVIIEDLQE